jgi:hypothetical protein
MSSRGVKDDVAIPQIPLYEREKGRRLLRAPRRTRNDMAKLVGFIDYETASLHSPNITLGEEVIPGVRQDEIRLSDTRTCSQTQD